MQFALKRVFDILFALFCSIFAIPLTLIAMLVIHICSPESPVIFKQKRVGYKNKQFTIYKLRTMTNEKDENGNLLSDELRLKTWGKIIRKLSIDELPQIINIFAWQMSFIGPRPLLPEEMQVMTAAEQAERQSVLPGITGWEAVNEEKSDSRREMAMFDLYYVRNFSIALDLKIFFLTAKKLFVADRSDDAHRAPKLKYEEIITENAKEEVYEQLV